MTDSILALQGHYLSLLYSYCITGFVLGPVLSLAIYTRDAVCLLGEENLFQSFF